MGEAPGNRGVDVHGGRGWRRANLRSGYTTGACAAAASAAAVRALLASEPVTQISIRLPSGWVDFPVHSCRVCEDRAMCSVIKDAGDDPDVTHGILVTAEVSLHEQPGIQIEGGTGVGRVTLPGLPVQVGQPAINPAPRRMITDAVQHQLEQLAAGHLQKTGLQVVISVPEGERIAAQTMNPRLGIVGGISILGTSGIVRPYSHPAYRISIHYELKVARQVGVQQALLATGRRSEAYGCTFLHLVQGPGVVEVGDHVGYAVRQAARLGFQKVILATMVGKLSKLAQSRMQTHASQGGVDFDYLAGTAAELGAAEELVEKVRRAKTAHHVQGMLDKAGIGGFERYLARQAAAALSDLVNGALTVGVLVFSMQGQMMAQEEV